MMYNNYDIIDSITRELYRQKDNLILEQLGDLVSKGLLICEEGPMSIYQDMSKPGHHYNLAQEVRFVLKDKEYITKLETENKELRETIERIKKVL